MAESSFITYNCGTVCKGLHNKNLTAQKYIFDSSDKNKRALHFYTLQCKQRDLPSTFYPQTLQTYFKTIQSQVNVKQLMFHVIMAR
jgi:hypothetical protein